MSAMVPVVARAAGFGAGVGVGMELIARGEAKGRLFAIATVAAAALQAVAYFVGWGICISACLGAVASLASFDERGLTVAEGIMVVAGGAILGGCAGYWLGSIELDPTLILQGLLIGAFIGSLARH